jgi:glycosyltransferase involved in cell wall biosynthesis
VRAIGPQAVRGVVRHFCARADRVIVPSRHTRDALMEDGIMAHFAVVPSGATSVKASPDGRERVRAQLGIAAETPLLVYISRIAPEKRVDLLLRAIALLLRLDLPAAAAGFRVIIVGDGQCRAEMEAMAAGLGLADRVRFVGAQPFATIGDWYAAGDIFVFSSPAETQGLALVEAMSVGLPCVAVDRGGPRELVAPGETGLLTPFEPAAFADAIRLLLCEPAMRRRMGESGRQRSLAFSPEAMAHGVLTVYQEILQAHSARSGSGMGKV